MCVAYVTWCVVVCSFYFQCFMQVCDILFSVLLVKMDFLNSKFSVQLIFSSITFYPNDVAKSHKQLRNGVNKTNIRNTQSNEQHGI